MLASNSVKEIFQRQKLRVWLRKLQYRSELPTERINASPLKLSMAMEQGNRWIAIELDEIQLNKLSQPGRGYPVSPAKLRHGHPIRQTTPKGIDFNGIKPLM